VGQLGFPQGELRHPTEARVPNMPAVAANRSHCPSGSDRTSGSDRRSTVRTLTPAQQAALDQRMLPFMLRFGGRANVRVQEVANELRMSPDFIRDLVECGELEFIAARSGKGKTDGRTYVILTRSVILWMLRNSNVSPDVWREDVRQLIGLWSVEELRYAGALINSHLERMAGARPGRT
jgi:hypothetical protein